MLLNIIIPTRQEFDDVISSILNSPGYKHLNDNLTDIIEKLKQKIAEEIYKLIRRSFSNVSDSMSVSKKLSTIMLIIGFLIILGIIAAIIIKANKIMDKRKKVNEILGEKIDNRTTPKSLRDKASVCMKSGEYREAIRYDFIALLLLMHERNIIYLDETKTNREIYSYLRNNNFKMLGIFGELINTFNLSWYGHKPCNNEIYDSWDENIKLLWNEVIGYEEKN